jgi:thiol-disulfide isomerase/thioredoxin
MSRTLKQPSTRSRVNRPAWPWLVAVFLGLPGTGSAEEPPRLSPTEAILNLTDGGFLPGSLDDSSRPGKVRWKSAAFTNPLDFPVGEVQSIRFPTPEKMPKPSGSLGFELTGGDILYGSIVSLDDKIAELDISRLGRITVERSRLRRIFRWGNGAGLVYNGPNGLAGWRDIQATKPRPAPDDPQQGVQGMMIVGRANARMPLPTPKPAVPTGPAWVEEGGQLHSTRDGATIQVGVDLPAKASLEIELSWKNTPDFALAIGFSDDESSLERAFRFEVWDKEIVAYRVLGKTAKLASVMAMKDGPGRLQVKLFLDQEQGKLLIASATGEVLGEIKLGGLPDPILGGVRLTNIHGDIRLERLRISRWDGETPRPMANNLSQVQMTDMTSSQGYVERFDPTSREFVVKGESGETRIIEDQVSSIILSCMEDNAPRTVRALYQDGARISGEWVKVDGGSLVLASPGIAAPLRLPLDGISSLSMAVRDVKVVEKPPQTGMLEMDGVNLLGRLVNSGDQPGEGGPLAWQPLAGESSSPIRSGASGKIIYKLPTSPATATSGSSNVPKRAIVRQQAVPMVRVGVQPQNVIGGFIEAFKAVPEQPSTQRRSLYLRSGDIIPAEVLKIDEKGVTFRSELSLSSFVPHARIKAVELANDSALSIKLNKTKFERLLTLPRMQRDSPPTQMIRSRNGDILRARIVAMDDKTIRVEIRLEEKEIPRDRISRIIWLHADETDPSKKVAEPPEPASTNRVQAVRSDGIRLTFNAERFADDILSGKSDVLGECKVRMKDLDMLLIGGSVQKETTQLAYQNWKLQNAPDPKSAQLDDEGSPNGGAAGTESALVGKPAPDFELDLLGGKKFHLSENKGKVIVLDFWATWCGPCLQAMPQIDRVTHEFADKGVQLIAVNLQEAPEKISAMLERQKLSPTVALDRDGVVAARYAANAIPQTVVIDRDGKITRLFIGGGPKLGDQLREALEALMPRENP